MFSGIVMKLHVLLVTLSCLAFVGCTDGGGDDDSGGGDGGGGNEQRACELLGLSSRASALPRIINGDRCANESSSPVVRLLLEIAEGQGAICSGTMLTNTTVLTAAHCFEQRPRTVVLRVGKQDVFARRVIVHPDYRSGATPFNVIAGFNDVAIVELETSVNLPTLPILVSRDTNSGESMQIYGFGLDEDENVSILQGGTATIAEVTNDHIVTLFNGSQSNTCEGDSGGPGTINTSQGLALVAVTSSGTIQSCGPGDVSIYINLQSSSVLNFIQDQVPGVRLQ
jgi:secreted trypsin-like serine protease